MVDTKDIAVVIQGALNREATLQIAGNVRNFFPGAEIVLATYDGADTTSLDYDKIVLVEDPGFYPSSDAPDARPNNISRQIQTTLAGLRAATRRYALKIRSDFVLTGRDFLDYFPLFPKVDSNYQVFEHKILSCVFFARDPRKKKQLSFHPSDIAFFGQRTDLLKLFDVPLMKQEESLFCEIDGYRHCKFVPEQHLWVNCLRKNGKKINFEHMGDITPENAEETEMYTVSNFIYLDYEQFNLAAPTHLTTFANNDFHDVITHIEWQRLYKRYLDNTLVVPDKDPMRELINQKTNCVKWCNFIARNFTIFFFGNRLRNFRKKTRMWILEYLAKNVCLSKRTQEVLS